MHEHYDEEIIRDRSTESFKVGLLLSVFEPLGTTHLMKTWRNNKGTVGTRSCGPEQDICETLRKALITTIYPFSKTEMSSSKHWEWLAASSTNVGIVQQLLPSIIPSEDGTKKTHLTLSLCWNETIQQLS